MTDHQHHYVHLSTRQEIQRGSYGYWRCYTRYDDFFCEGCLDMQTKERSVDGPNVEKPDWWDANIPNLERTL